MTDTVAPKAYEKAMHSPQAEYSKELNYLKTTWDFVPLPESAMYQLCAKGFSQVEGEDHEEIFSPILRADTGKILVIAA
ncbi:hypothetical protein TNCV_2869771 [Trichonephila clavipes]|nr:hypothetical protein TNCV_2869771 [Trichonephila clavipes]